MNKIIQPFTNTLSSINWSKVTVVLLLLSLARVEFQISVVYEPLMKVLSGMWQASHLVIPGLGQ